jgi:type 1 glutamine amidotransferase
MNTRLFTAFLLLAAGLSAAPTRILMLIGEDEYKTWETLPAFAASDLRPQGYAVTIVQEDPRETNHFPGLIAALPRTDVLLLSTRRRAPRREELAAFRAYLDRGGALVGIRTACHGFALLPSTPVTDPRLDHWNTFDPEVLGGHYRTHYRGNDLTVATVASGEEHNPILAGVAVQDLIGHGELYEVRPLVADARPLLYGTIPNELAEPLAWTHLYGPRHDPVFYTSLGSPEDFAEPAFRRLLLNAIQWCVEQRRN